MDAYLRFAAVYDPLLHVGMYKIRKKVVDVLHRHQVHTVVDLCCGTGNQLKYLKKNGFDDIAGVDLSAGMLRQSRKGKVKVNCGLEDATQTSYPASRFDAAVISFALHEKPLDVAAAMLQEARRIVKTGGLLLVVDYVFDEKTKKSGKYLISMVERMAGREHYRNFRAYLLAGGLHSLMQGQEHLAEHPFHRGGTRLRLYRV